jgi:transcriptional regulator with XRE-family HTH domain
MFKIDGDLVRRKVRNLMKQMGISKGKLGEVLGSKGDHPNVRINRANRFLTGGKKKITIEEINRLAEFFAYPVSWFLFDDEIKANVLESGKSDRGRADTATPLREIEKNLRTMGFDEPFIATQMELLKAMEAYRAAQKKRK